MWILSLILFIASIPDSKMEITVSTDNSWFCDCMLCNFAIYLGECLQIMQYITHIGYYALSSFSIFAS